MINEKEVKHIAKLARLGLTQAEIKKFQKELSAILDYSEKLKEVDISGIEPTSHSVLIENVMREDREDERYKPGASRPVIAPQLTKPGASRPVIAPQLRKMKSEELLKLAPETKNGYLKTKSIL